MYNLTLVTGPTVEPLTVQEAKDYLRLSSTTTADNITTYQSITPGSHGVIAAFGLAGAVVGVYGKTTLIYLNAGACGAGGSISAKIQESENGSTWTDFTGGAFTTVTEANDNAVQEIQYTGGKTYVRIVATVAVAACEFSADVVVEGPGSTDDAYLQLLITTAREYCEDFQRRAYITQTWRMTLDWFPHGEIEIPKGMLQTIDEVAYLDSDGSETVLVEDTDYIVTTDGILGKIAPLYSQIWPTAVLYPLNPVSITYTCGYGDTAVYVPGKVRQAMYMLISHWYENRIATVIGTTSGELQFAVNALLRMDRIEVF
jgi:uncharacterized phiE125 gp8 family phage protein